MAAVCCEIKHIVSTNAQKSNHAALSSWVWDDVDAELLVQEHPPQVCDCLRPQALGPSATGCIDNLHTILREQHTLLIQECSCLLN